MKKYPIIPGFEYEKQPYDEYIADTINLVGLDGWEVEDLGVCSDGENHVYGLSLGDPSKPTIFFNQTHGLSEWRTFYWLRGFAKYLVNPTKPIHKPMMAELRRKFHFYIIPGLNVYGYINNTRWNANGVDLNRNFPPYWNEWEDPGGGWGTKGDAPFSEVESRMVRDKVLQYRPVLFVDCHTWGDFIGNTNHLAMPEHKELYWLARDVHSSIRLSHPVRPATYGGPFRRPTSQNWVATVKSDRGFHPFVALSESGGGMPESQQAEVGMTMMFIYSMGMLHYLDKRTLRVR